MKMLSVVLKSECGTAKLSLPLFVLFSCLSRYVVFVEHILLNDILVWLLCMKPSDFANFRPIRGQEIISHHRQRIDILAGAAQRVVPAKTITHNHTYGSSDNHLVYHPSTSLNIYNSKHHSNF